MSTVNLITNPLYDLTIDEVVKVRNVIAGGFFVKLQRTKYLPHPSDVDQTSKEAVARYNRFLMNAEFDDFTSVTERVMVGRLKLDDLKFEPDQKLSYLIQDVDKDGLSINGLCESLASNILAVKFHLLLVDYQGLSDVGIKEASIADVKRVNPRATIKQYSRENVIDWDFARINGRMQLTYLLLREIGVDVDRDSGAKTQVKSYLKLALDENGQYYQQKRVDGGEYGEASQVMANGKALDFIPALIVTDKDGVGSEMPAELGYLSTLAEIALNRYRVSADYKEALSTYKPTTHVSGMDQSAYETFKEVNGRDYMAVGGVNMWDKDVTVSLTEPNGSLQQYKEYFEETKTKVKALGGVFKTDATVQRTATEIINESEVTNSILSPIVNAIESNIKWAVAYCAMFEGLVAQESLGAYVENVDFTMARDFGISKLSVEEVRALSDLYLGGNLPRIELLKLLEVGGWLITDAETLITQLDESL